MVFADTDVMVDVLREHAPALAWLSSLGDEEIVLSGFVAMELLQGCRNKPEQARVESQLRAFQIVWPTADTCDRALAAFAQHHLTHSLGILDAVICQQAISLGASLGTFNAKHYAAVPGLTLAQPYAR